MNICLKRVHSILVEISICGRLVEVEKSAVPYKCGKEREKEREKRDR